MGFLHQLHLLLWKNISLKRRGSWVLAFEIFIPLVLFFILLGLRQKKPAIPVKEVWGPGLRRPRSMAFRLCVRTGYVELVAERSGRICPHVTLKDSFVYILRVYVTLDCATLANFLPFIMAAKHNSDSSDGSALKKRSRLHGSEIR